MKYKNCRNFTLKLNIDITVNKLIKNKILIYESALKLFIILLIINRFKYIFKCTLNTMNKIN